MARRDEEIRLHPQDHGAQVEVGSARKREKAGKIRQRGAGHTQPVDGWRKQR